jgi:hypothetical protein
MATRKNLPRSKPRSKSSAAIIHRLRAYRSQPSNIPAPGSLTEFMESLDWRSYVHLRFLQLAHRLSLERARRRRVRHGWILGDRP